VGGAAIGGRSHGRAWRGDGQNPNRPDWKTIYEQVCRQHDGIDAFRAKLLGLLPLASGSAGIFLLLSDRPKDAALPHLLAIGAFGFLTGLGLFRYELRGIQKCSALIRCAKELEGDYLMRQANGPGAFVRRPDEVTVAGISADVTGAAMVIYPTVLAGWAYMAGLGLLSLAGLPLAGSTLTAALVLAAAVLLGFWGWGWTVRRRQRKQAAAEARDRERPATASPAASVPAAWAVVGALALATLAMARGQGRRGAPEGVPPPSAA
jgi:hypothetical protein